MASLVTARELNQRSFDFIKNEERWKPCARMFVKIGYGHKIASGDGLDIPNIPNKYCINETQGLKLLKSDINVATSCISHKLSPSVLSWLSDNQFGAIVSWTYSVGCSNAISSALIQKLNEATEAELKNWSYFLFASEVNKWIYSRGKPLDSLITRRNRECNLFVTP